MMMTDNNDDDDRYGLSNETIENLSINAKARQYKSLIPL